MDVINYEVIIIGGSYSGLSAAMALGRSLRSVLIIDSGLPCNRQTPHSHNFLTQDGKTPKEISKVAKQQLTIRFSRLMRCDGDSLSNFNLKTLHNLAFTALKKFTDPQKCGEARNPLKITRLHQHIVAAQ